MKRGSFVSMKSASFVSTKCASFVSVKYASFLSMKCVTLVPMKSDIFSSMKRTSYLSMKRASFFSIKCANFLSTKRASLLLSRFSIVDNWEGNRAKHSDWSESNFWHEKRSLKYIGSNAKECTSLNPSKLFQIGMEHTETVATFEPCKGRSLWTRCI